MSFLFAAAIFAPGPVHAHVRIVLGLAGNGVSVTEKKLLVGVVLEVVVAARNRSGWKPVSEGRQSLPLRAKRPAPPSSRRWPKVYFRRNPSYGKFRYPVWGTI